MSEKTPTVAELFSEAYRPDLKLEFPSRQELNYMFHKVERKKLKERHAQISARIGELNQEMYILINTLASIRSSSTKSLDNETLERREMTLRQMEEVTDEIHTLTCEMEVLNKRDLELFRKLH
jgi:hypothetical protein